MSLSSATSALQIAGKGLITGQPVTVDIERAEAGHGIVFYIDGVSPIPARLASVVHTDRGVTLANAERKTLSIVEHFLCACSLAGLSDLRVTVSGAPEMPILDGSALEWLKRFRERWDLSPPRPQIALPQAVYLTQDEHIRVYAIPDAHFKISYSVDFNHPDLSTRWTHWDSAADDWDQLAAAGTFGYLSELPAMQAKGLALGADADNTLGLIETGGYSRPVRFPDEPIYHKMLDLIGDLTLSGLNPLALKAHVFAINAGHGSHTAFARRLLAALGHPI